jgi:hypothetical protein
MQPGRMEINMIALGAKYVRKRVTILDRARLLDKGICIWILIDSCGYKQNIILTSMLRG